MFLHKDELAVVRGYFQKTHSRLRFDHEEGNKIDEGLGGEDESGANSRCVSQPRKEVENVAKFTLQ